MRYFKIDGAAIVFAALVVVIVFFYLAPDGIGPSGLCEVAHVIGIIGWDIADVVTVEGTDSNGVGVVLVLRLCLDVAHELAYIAIDAESEVNACNIVVNNIGAFCYECVVRLNDWKWTSVCFIIAGFDGCDVAASFDATFHFFQQK